MFRRAQRSWVPLISLALGAGVGRVTTASAPSTVLEQITHENRSDPSFSPDGRRMVVVSVIGGIEQLSLVSVDGRGATLLTADQPFDHEDPAWSPDGRSIAYVSLAGKGEVIHVMDADGQNDRPLTPATQRSIHPSWSPDGRTLLYCTDDDLHPPKKNDAEIYSVDAGTGGVRKIISGGVNTYPSYSPDGRRIVFRKMVGESNSEVFVADADGSHEINLTQHPAFDGWPAWSPDGRQIAFASNREGNYQIYIMNADGSDVRLLARSEGRGTAPKWTPDASRIFFSICRSFQGVGRCEIFAAGVPVFTPTGPAI